MRRNEAVQRSLYRVAVNAKGNTQSTKKFCKPRQTLLQLSVVVLDESHDAKNEQSGLNESLCNLRFSKAILDVDRERIKQSPHLPPNLFLGGNP